MNRYFIRVLTFLVITCCLLLQTAEATADKDGNFGFGYMFTTVSNSNLIRSNGFSWKTPILENFSIQNVVWLLKNEKTSVGLTSRFLYTLEIHPRIQGYYGWGVNHPAWWRLETFIGFEFFSSGNADFGYVVEFGVSRLKLESEGSEDSNKLSSRLLLGYHFYF